MKKFDFSRFNLYTILRDVLMNWWVILLALIIGFVGSFSYFTFLHKQKYVSSMTVSINLSGYTSEATALSLARTVVIAENLDDVFQSNALRDVVEKDMGMALTGEIKAQQIGETNLIKISVTDVTPSKAYDTLVSIYNNYYKVTDYVFTNVIIRTVVNPSMPGTAASAMGSLSYGGVFGVLAGMIVVAIIVLLSFLRNTIKNVSDVEKELEMKLFGTVAHIKDLGRDLPMAKKRLIITNPLIGPGFANSFKKMAVKIESLFRTKKYKTFMVTSVAENEGKTSASVNTALALAQNGNKVLLMDCDFKNPSVFRFFDDIDKSESNDLRNLVASEGDVSQYIKQDLETGLYILGNSKPYSGSEDILSSSQFLSVFNQLKDMFDYIILDTPPCGITVDAEILSNVVDGALIVVRQDVVEVPDINDQIANLDKCYLAGCIFNDVCTIGRGEDEYYLTQEVVNQ